VADAVVGDHLSDTVLSRSLLALMPHDVRVLAVASVDDDFHAQHDAVAKTYAYTLDRTRAGNPFLARFALHEPRPLDDDAIETALRWLPGTRDWSGFTGSACAVRDRVRTLTVARRVRARPDVDEYVFTADGFLTHMVRNLVGTILDVGLGRLDPERLAAIVASGDRGLAGATAPPHGLCLVRVDYRNAPGTGAAPGPETPLW
jgi:tRNA pseudouridine38-40 synthase